MNRTEFVSILSKRVDLSKFKCEQVMKEFKNIILDACCQGEQVAFRDFGKFSLQEKKERKFLNPQTRRYYICPSKKYISFKGYKNFVKNIK